MRMGLLIASAAGALALGTSAAAAADLAAYPSPPAPTAAPPTSTTFSIETDPEFYAADKSPSQPAGTMADDFVKVAISHTFGGVWVLSGSLQPQIDIQSNGGDKYRYYAEGDLGYKIKLNSFTLTPTVGIGDVWGDTGITSASVSAVYYAFFLAGDWKLSSKWTWNVFNVRYRNAFDYTWITPKVSTGVTYNINSQNAIYTSIGYSWKDTGAGLKPDKVNVGLGYKYSF